MGDDFYTQSQRTYWKDSQYSYSSYQQCMVICFEYTNLEITEL